MPLRGRARLKSDLIVGDFNHYDWWRALVKSGVPPSEAWMMDFIETAYVLEIEPSRIDMSLALFHQRKQNGEPDLCQQNNL